MTAKRKNRSLKQLVRPMVRKLRGYVPGEQPNVPGLIKLNTNENPAPPSPEVIRALRSAADERLRRYPRPKRATTARGVGQVARLQAGKHHRW